MAENGFLGDGNTPPSDWQAPVVVATGRLVSREKEARARDRLRYVMRED